MPLVSSTYHSTYGHSHIWQIIESEDFFKEKLKDNSSIFDRIQSWHKTRRIEWMAGRYLLKKWAGIWPDDILVEASGKPNHHAKDKFFSISHSQDYVGLLIHSGPCGLDIQASTPKIARIASKFYTDEDHEMLNPYWSEDTALHIAWTLKESMYKTFGKLGVDFRKHIHFRDIDMVNMTCRGYIQTDLYKEEYMSKITIQPEFYQARTVKLGS